MELETKDVETDVEVGALTVVCLEEDLLVLAVTKDRKEDTAVLEAKKPLMGAAVVEADVGRAVSETGPVVVVTASGSAGKDAGTLTAGGAAVEVTVVVEMSGAATVVAMAVSGREGAREAATSVPVEVATVVGSTGKDSVVGAEEA